MSNLVETVGTVPIVLGACAGVVAAAMAWDARQTRLRTEAIIAAMPRMPVPGAGLKFDEEDWLPGFASRHGGHRLHTYRTRPARSAPPRAVMLMFHGWNEHASRHAHVAREFASRGLVACAMDMRGHGKSGGRRGYIYPNYHSFADDAWDFMLAVQREYPGLPVFAYGLSMGGKTVLHLAIRDAERPAAERHLAGLVLAVPAIKAKEDMNPWLQKVAGFIARVAPGLPVVRLARGLGTGNACNLEDFEQDPLCHKGMVTAATGASLLESCLWITANLHRVATPFFCVQGERDRMVERDGVGMLHERAATPAEHKALKFYDCEHDVVHEHLADVIIADFADWVEARLKLAGR
jgi:alpha-beta hydrolase superfamily lysophospholipase